MNTSLITVSKNNDAHREYYSPSELSKAVFDAAQNSTADERVLIKIRPEDYTNQSIRVPENVYILAYPGAMLNWDNITGAIENVVDLNVLGGLDAFY
jgi:hypothetical protein